jgi:thioredoxin-like negative regulator of GroEL
MIQNKTIQLACIFKILLLLLFGKHNCHALYDSNENSWVQVIDDAETFDETVVQSDGIWMIQFYAPGCAHSQQFVEKYKRLALVTRGIVHVGVVDATTESGAILADRYDVKGFPTLFTFGFDKSNPLQYLGSRDTRGMSQALIAEVMRIFISRGEGQEPLNKGPSRVVELSDDNFDALVLKSPNVSMVAFVSPMCVYCSKLKPAWEEAAHRLSDKGVLLGYVDATIEEGLAIDYDVTSFPSIKVFSNGNVKDYNGPRGSDHIYDFALDELNKHTQHVPVEQEL